MAPIYERRCSRTVQTFFAGATAILLSRSLASPAEAQARRDWNAAGPSDIWETTTANWFNGVGNPRTFADGQRARFNTNMTGNYRIGGI